MEELEMIVRNQGEKIGKYARRIEEIDRVFGDFGGRLKRLEDKEEITDMRFRSIEEQNQRLELKVDKYGTEQIEMLKSMIRHSQKMEEEKSEFRRTKSEQKNEIITRVLSYVGGIGVVVWAIIQFILGMN